MRSGAVQNELCMVWCADTVTQMHMSKVHGEMERVCQNCLDRIDSVRQSLMEAGVLTEARAKQMIEEHMLPLVGEQQRIFENNLETMEVSLVD
jgi:hypothetical protein